MVGCCVAAVGGGVVGGCAFLFLAFLEALYVLSFFFRGTQGRLVPGWSSLMIVILVSSGISLLVVCILGVYIGMIFEEAKTHPVYLARTRRHIPARHSSHPTNTSKATLNTSRH